MTNDKLKRKSELYLKLGGRLTKGSGQNCFKCLLHDRCRRDPQVKRLARRVFLRAKAGKRWYIVGFGIDFGIKEVDVIDGQSYNFVALCVEWLDQDPRL